MNCKYCNREIRQDYVPQLVKEMNDNQLCFDCHYWIIGQGDKHIITKEYIRYYVAGDNTITKGFGGDTFKITKLDGTTFLTNNLWYNGEIPLYLRQFFTPDTEEICLQRK